MSSFQDLPGLTDKPNTPPSSSKGSDQGTAEHTVSAYIPTNPFDIGTPPTPSYLKQKRQETPARLKKYYTADAFVKCLRDYRERQRPYRLYIRESEYQLAWTQIRADTSLLGFIDDKLRFDYYRHRNLFLLYMPSPAHEDANILLINTINEYLNTAQSQPPAGHISTFTRGIASKGGPSVTIPYNSDPEFVPSSGSDIDTDESEVRAPSPTRQLRPRLAEATYIIPTTPPSPNALSSPASPVRKSHFVPDYCWRHERDETTRVAVEIAKTERLTDLEIKVEQLICHAGFNIVFGLILHHPKPRLACIQDKNTEEGAVVLKIWEVQHVEVEPITNQVIHQRQMRLKTTITLLTKALEIPSGLSTKFRTCCYVDSFVSREVLYLLINQTPALEQAVLAYPPLYLDLQHLGRKLRDIRQPPNTVLDVTSVDPKSLREMNDRLAKRDRDNSEGETAGREGSQPATTGRSITKRPKSSYTASSRLRK